MTPPTLHERLAVFIARQMRDDDVGFTGLTTGGPTAMYGTYIPVAGMQLARLTSAPNLTLLLAGWCHNPDLFDLQSLPRSEFPLSWQHIPAEAHKVTWPGMHSIYRGDVTIGFSSAPQIDQYGNMNTVSVHREDRSAVRLVGPVFVTEHLACFGREIVMMPRHDRRTFVERVDFIAGVGHRSGSSDRASLGLPGQGPVLVISPLGIFDFDPSDGRMRLRWLHPGVEVSDVAQNTAFQLISVDVEPTPEPTEEELYVLRSRIDRQGFLRR